jgi:hypothetical protein
MLTPQYHNRNKLSRKEIQICVSFTTLTSCNLQAINHVSLQDSPGVNGLQVATGQQLLPCCEEQQFFSFISLSKQT